MYLAARLASRSRSLATAAVTPRSATEHGSAQPLAAHKPTVPIPLSNIEAHWEHLSKEERVPVLEVLEEAQKKDWKTLSIDEKKAAYYVAFGPHGPRAPASKPGENAKVFFVVAGLVGLTALVSPILSWAIGGEKPRTINKEWEEATTQRAIEQRINPITGVSSQKYSGKGFVQSD